MKKQTLFTVAAVATSLLLSGGSLVAADDSSQNQNQNQSDQQSPGSSQEIKASKLIGKSVKDPQGQTVCEIRDLVVNLNTGATHYAIVNCGGVAGMGGKKIAIPLNAIQASSDGTLTISASKQDLESASTTPQGAWAFASGQEWTQGVEGYYGEPRPMNMNGRFERENPQSPNSGREPVRNDMSQPSQSGDQPKAAEQQEMNGQQGASQYGNQPTTTAALQDTINQTIQQNFGQAAANGVQANVNNGVVTLTGNVDSQSTKDSIESKVQGLPGVQRVDDQLQVKQSQ